MGWDGARALQTEPEPPEAKQRAGGRWGLTWASQAGWTRGWWCAPVAQAWGYPTGVAAAGGARQVGVNLQDPGR